MSAPGPSTVPTDLPIFGSVKARTRRPVSTETLHGFGHLTLDGPSHLMGSIPTPSNELHWREMIADAYLATTSGEESAYKHYQSALAAYMSSRPPIERMEDIKKLLHPTFRLRLFDELSLLHTTAVKLVGVEQAIRSLEKNKFEKKFPTVLNPVAKAKVRTQFTSLYPAEMQQSANNRIAVLQSEMASKLLDEIITQKRGEKAHLDGLLARESYEKRLRDAISRDYQAAKIRYGERPQAEDVDMSVGDQPTEARAQRDNAGDIKAPEFLSVERDAAFGLAPLLAIRVLEMARIKQSNKDYVLEKKISLKERTVLKVGQEAPESEEARLKRLIKSLLPKDMAKPKNRSNKRKGKTAPKVKAPAKPQGIKKTQKVRKPSTPTSKKTTQKRVASSTVVKGPGKKAKV